MFMQRFPDVKRTARNLSKALFYKRDLALVKLKAAEAKGRAHEDLPPFDQALLDLLDCNAQLDEEAGDEDEDKDKLEDDSEDKAETEDEPEDRDKDEDELKQEGEDEDAAEHEDEDEHEDKAESPAETLDDLRTLLSQAEERAAQESNLRLAAEKKSLALKDKMVAANGKVAALKRDLRDVSDTARNLALRNGELQQLVETSNGQVEAAQADLLLAREEVNLLRAQADGLRADLDAANIQLQAANDRLESGPSTTSALPGEAGPATSTREATRDGQSSADKPLCPMCKLTWRVRPISSLSPKEVKDHASYLKLQILQEDQRQSLLRSMELYLKVRKDALNHEKQDGEVIHRAQLLSAIEQTLRERKIDVTVFSSPPQDQEDEDEDNVSEGGPGQGEDESQ